MRILVAALVALALAAPALASERHPTQSELEAELICPICRTPLDESDSPPAQDIKQFIREKIALGWTKSEIKDALVEDLGPGVLGVPRTHGFDLLAWALPIGGICIGALALGGGAWYWSRNRPGSEPGPTEDDTPLDPELDRRVDEALARFDA